MLLDASKAFDKVEYVKLFQLLLEKGLCPLYARLIAAMYTRQSVRLKWGNYISNSFHALNGVKQGGVLSPILFIIYMDTLLNRLSTSGYGCYIVRKFMGAFGYATMLSHFPLLCMP